MEQLRPEPEIHPKSPKITTTLIRGGAGAGKWQERLCVLELPHGASTIAAKVWRWRLKSEERDNRTTYGMIHQRSGVDDHPFAFGRVCQDEITVRRG